MANEVNLDRRPRRNAKYNEPYGFQEVYDKVFEGDGYSISSQTGYEDENDIIVDVIGLCGYYFQLINEGTVSLTVKIQRTNKNFQNLSELTDDDFVDDDNFTEETVAGGASSEEYQLARITTQATAIKIRLNTGGGAATTANGVSSGR